MKTHTSSPNPPPGSPKTRLTPEQREEIIRRLDAGERGSRLAREFGVSTQAISLYRKNKDGELQGAVNKKMTGEEVEKLRQMVGGSVPSQHGLPGLGSSRRDEWGVSQVQALAEKMFGRKLFRLQFKSLVDEWFPNRSWDCPYSIVREPMTVEEIQAAMARDAKFHNFVESPVAGEIRTHERARPKMRDSAKIPMPPPGMWETLSPVGQKAPSPTNLPPGPVRTGKHKGSKGNPFTKARKKKKR